MWHKALKHLRLMPAPTTHEGLIAEATALIADTNRELERNAVALAEARAELTRLQEKAKAHAAEDALIEPHRVM